MSLYSTIRFSKPIQLLRRSVPNEFINTVRHYPNALLANIYYRFPSRYLQVIGVTGTDGKTTTTTGIYQLLKTAKYKVAMVSTVKAVLGTQEYDTGFHVTTPDPWQLQKIISDIKRQYFRYLVLETTSHGFAQHRLYGIDFNIGVVTNITHDHLDYHGSYEHYWKSKAKLFDHVRVAILNFDDKSFPLLKKYLGNNNSKSTILTYGRNKEADIQCTTIELHPQGITFTCVFNQEVLPQAPEKATFTLPVLGKYNVYNAMAVISVGYCLALPTKTIRQALSSLPQIPGRMDVVVDKPWTVVVDFAHTPNALDNALDSLNLHFVNKNKHNRLISIFGCAGLRDIKKRPLMGEISANKAEITIITAEDPRTEDLGDIIEQIAVGCRQAGAKELHLDEVTQKRLRGRIFIRVPDRQQAIDLAINKIAKPGDVIGVFGKGHEQSMCYGTVEYPWSDHKAISKAIKKTN